CGGPGPPQLASHINYQEYNGYIEYAPTKCFSTFLEVPVRSIVFANGSNPNVTGFSDINAGVKYALIADCDRYFTLQTKLYSPTGDAARGLGTRHVSAEPGFLV